MCSESELRAANRTQGLRTKTKNLLAAVFSGAALIFISVRMAPPSAAAILAGMAIGLVYANGFEYALHRYLLHSGHGIFSRHHMIHHSTLNTPEAAVYLNCSRNPLGVVALFCVNAAPFLVLQHLFRSASVAGVFAGFAVYYVAFE